MSNIQVNFLLLDILESLHRERRSKQPLRILADHIIRRKPPEFIKEFIEEEDLFGCLDEPIKKGLRLLHYAVYQDEMGIVLLLLDYDANPNVMDEIGYTPVHICAEKGYNHLIQILMSYGARIRFTELNPEDQSYGHPPRATLADEPLRLAIRNCEHETARFLLEHGANPCALYYLGYEINLVNPVDFESIELLLLYGADVNSRDLQGLTPLMKACRHSQAFEAVHLLISYGADVNAKSIEDEKTSLHYAVLTGNLEIVQILICNGARVSFPLERTRPPPLYYAVLRGHVEILEFLLDSGADINAVSTVVGSALHLALTEKINNQLEIVHTLLRRGANPNAITLDDNKPVLKPPIGEYLQNCEHPRLDIVKLLLRYGARIVLEIQKNHNYGILKVIHRIHLGLNPEVMSLLIEASEAFNVSFIEQSRQLSDDHKDLLCKKALEPFSLQHIARLQYRRNLGWGPAFLNTIQNLEIPKCLKGYLLFEE
ncbi:putative ankyrin repeat protein [Trichonephila inaurata madagascariensis]|uniref:Putative ankyrin repeat protein n=1 Tax=Trichonephila inaurata madagascariensis TaxID=2747483 RepID=A0A8X6WPV1_9ARAC|nr:putative ankyrin repeat protein [Trichonephila inaurata madagascariensis]